MSFLFSAIVTLVGFGLFSSFLSKCIFNTINKDFYKLIFEFRKNIVSDKFYFILNEFKRLENEYFKGNVPYNMYHVANLRCDELYKEFSVYNGWLRIDMIDLKMPKDGPYTDEQADRYCLQKFSRFWRKECELAIKNYYKEKGEK